MWGCIKSLTEAKVDAISCSSLIHQNSHSIIEGYKVGQACFSLGETLLAVSNPTTVSSMCLDIASRKICSIIIPGTEVRLTDK